MEKQTLEDRLRRLADGCCPVHGIGMTHAENVEFNGNHRFLAECPRNDCNIQATTHEPHGPCALLAEFNYLLKPTHASG